MANRASWLLCAAACAAFGLAGCAGEATSPGGASGNADTADGASQAEVAGTDATLDTNGADTNSADTNSADTASSDTLADAAETGTSDTAPDAAPQACAKDADCPAATAPCQVATCVDGQCAQVAAADGATCTPVSSCSLGGACQAGQCVGSGIKSCDDGNVCTADACVPKTGDCAHEAVNEDVVCDDGNACTYKETCFSGVCAAGAAKDCDDGNPCTADLCLPESGKCAHKAGAAKVACDDGNACTKDDACDADGACQGGSNSCACKADSDCAGFEDGKLCNGTLFCELKTGTCTINPATVVTCAASDEPCVVNACDEDKGACSAIPVPQGQACDDGNLCTTGTQCDGKGGCAGGSATCACLTDADCAGQNDADPCNGTLFCNKAQAPFQCAVNPATVVVCNNAKDTACSKNQCNKTTGTCAMTELPNKTACDDGQVCTKGDACLAGSCKPGTDVCKCSSDADCKAADDGNLCNGVAFCNQASGSCEFNPASVVTCPTVADTYCAKNTCQPTTGDCVMMPAHVSESCDDGNTCTVGEVCDAKGNCTASANTCACSEDADCAKLDDGDLCNGTLFCNKAKSECQLNPASVVTCPTVDDTVCAANTCQPKTGQCALKPRNDGFACDADGNSCTKDDFCYQGGCKAGSNVCECQKDDDCAGKQSTDLCAKLYCNGVSKTCQVNPATKVYCSPQDDTLCVVNQCEPKSGKCAMKPRNDGQACDADGSDCTSGDTCQKGACEAGPSSCQCQSNADCAAMDDGNPCNGVLKCGADSKCAVDLATVVTCQNDGDTPCLENRCDKADGKCKLTAINNKSPCGNGTLCTGVPLCNEGTCTTGADVDCDDKDACTTDSCDDYKGCLHAPQTGAPCDDGSLCTSDDACLKGTCTGSAVVCKEGTPCTIDACVPSKGCVYTPHGGICDDGNACTLQDTCVGTKCLSFKALGCDDGLVCTTDSCDKAKGCVHTLNTAPCNDGNACTKDDACSNGACTGKAINVKVDCDDGNACTSDACDAAAGCTYLKLTHGSGVENHHFCDDGKWCTNNQCTAGICVVTGPACSAKSGCNDFLCDEAKKTCTTVALKPGDVCDDNSVCTKVSTCDNALKCVGSVPLDCDDGNACTQDACNAALGCQHTSSTAACEDGDACTVGSKCASGVCQGGAALDCDDDQPCTADSCNPKSGCAHAPTSEGKACGDAAECQTQGVCKAGRCEGAIARPWQQGGLGVPASCGDIVAGDGGEWFVFGRLQNVQGVWEPAWMQLNFAGKPGNTWTLPSKDHGMLWTGIRGKSGLVAVGHTRDGAVGGRDGLFVRVAGEATVTTALVLGGSNDEVFYDLAPTADGGHLLVGVNQSKGAGGDDGWLVRLDKADKVAWDKALGTVVDDRLRAIVATDDGGFTAVGTVGAYAGWLLRLAADGAVVKERIDGDASDARRYLAVLALAGGESVVGDKVLRVFDKNGNPTTTIGFGGGGTATDVRARPGGGYAVSASQASLLDAKGVTTFATPAAAAGSAIDGLEVGARIFADGADSLISLGQGGCAMKHPDNFGHLACADSGACFLKAKADCADDSLCTKNESCSKGQCTSDSVLSAPCPDSDPCLVNAGCDPKTGKCSYPAKQEGAACANASGPCVVMGTCKSGVCGGDYQAAWTIALAAKDECCGEYDRGGGGLAEKARFESQLASFRVLATHPDGGVFGAGEATVQLNNRKTNAIYAQDYHPVGTALSYFGWNEVVAGCKTTKNHIPLGDGDKTDWYLAVDAGALKDGSTAVLASIPDISGMTGAPDCNGNCKVKGVANQCNVSGSSDPPVTNRRAAMRRFLDGKAQTRIYIGGTTTDPRAMAVPAGAVSLLVLARDFEGDTTKNPRQFSVYTLATKADGSSQDKVLGNTRTSFGNADEPADIDAHSDGGWLACGNTTVTNANSSLEEAFAVAGRFDKTGKLLWSDVAKSSNATTVHGCGWSAFGAVVAGKSAQTVAGTTAQLVWVRSLTEGGKLRWDRTYRPASGTTFMQDVLPVGDTVVLGGTLNGKSGLLRLDAFGTDLGDKTVSGVVRQWKAMPDGGFAGAGYAGGSPQIIRTDAFGNAPCSAVGGCLGKAFADCDDANGCTFDACDAVAGCTNTPVNDGNLCDDGDPCTDVGACAKSACSKGAPLPQKTACDDGDICTAVGQCAANGSCLAPSSCDDGKPCTADVCDAKTGACSHKAIAAGGACDDGVACTGATTCDAAGSCGGGKDLCVGGTKVCDFDADCDDKDGCTADTCASNVCVHKALAKGAACDDGSKCTENDACDAAGACKGSALDCADSNPCTVDACSESALCTHVPANDGAVCDDGNACTSDTTCKSGLCLGTSKCDDGELCTVASCNPDGSCAQAPVLYGVDCGGGFKCDGKGACLSTGGATGVLAGSTLNSCAIFNGKLSCWGAGGAGVIGDGDLGDRSKPALVSISGTPLDVALAGTGSTACALVKDAQGTRDVWCWGNNGYSLVAANGSSTYATPQKRAGTTGAVDVSVSMQHACVVFEQGHVACWGVGTAGQLNGSKLSGVKSTPLYVDGVSDAVKVAIGVDSTCVLRASGAIRCWGSNAHGQLGAGPQPAGTYGPVDVDVGAKFKALAAGFRHYCAQTTANELWCWGYNGSGQLGNGTTINSDVPVKVMTSLNNRGVVGAGTAATCAMDSGEWLHCWGLGTQGQIGDGNNTTVLGTTVKVVGEKLWMRAMSTFGQTPCMVQKDGRVYCWGSNSIGQVGDGTTTDRNVPTQITMP